jgi:hypothetical protein
VAYNFPNPPSRYAPIWKQLKEQGSVELIIVPSLKNRIVKAVRRRQFMDMEYRLNLAEQGKRVWIRYKFSQNKLSFYLQTFLNPEDI